jgi:ERCC4-related helicase
MNIRFGPAIPQVGHLLHMLPKQNKGTKLEIQLSKFCNKAIHIYEELGPWASDYFVLESVSVLARQQDTRADILDGGEIEERESLLQILDKGRLRKLRQNYSLQGPFLISDKVKNLLAFLATQDAENCSGILFVRQRATVSVMCKLLSIHPEVQGRFHCATFVGMSNNAARKYSMSELLDLKAQRETLVEFRARRKNLIIATDVLEEGIDVTACNLVFCFDAPPNVKSFIQRRGRARQEKCQFAIMFPKDKGAAKIESWRSLEETLIKTYQTEHRKIQDLRALEDDDVEIVPGKLVVESTG